MENKENFSLLQKLNYFKFINKQNINIIFIINIMLQKLNHKHCY